MALRARCRNGVQWRSEFRSERLHAARQFSSEFQLSSTIFGTQRSRGRAGPRAPRGFPHACGTAGSTVAKCTAGERQCTDGVSDSGFERGHSQNWAARTRLPSFALPPGPVMRMTTPLPPSPRALFVGSCVGVRHPASTPPKHLHSLRPPVGESVTWPTPNSCRW